MRSYLFVPGNDENKIIKAFDAEADAVVLDLEDSVAPQDRNKARSIVRDALEALPPSMRKTGPKAFVRVNPLGDGEAFRDLDSVMPGRPDGVLLPKCRDGENAKKFSEMLVAKESELAITTGTVKVIAIATETARSVFGLGSYGGSTPRLMGLGWGAEDLSADMGALANRDEQGLFLPPYQLVRSLCLIAAHAARVEAIDTVHINYKDQEGLKRECDAALRDGFTAKMAIHPAQIPIINEAFTPFKSDVESSRELVEAFANAGNPGVLGIDGQMYDRPHLLRAEKVVARAETYGMKDDPPPKKKRAPAKPRAKRAPRKKT
ncbi:MAG: CoA ester lyase [Alphaproteobacteria bacterium]|nr:CoA ester lyase [Alphaproteobacteria bacterium]